MESNDHRQRQINRPGYAGQPAVLQTNPQYTPSSTADRYRQASSLTALPPTSAPNTARGTNTASYNYAYSGEGSQYVGQQMQASALHYPTEYSSESHRGSQHYAQYGSSMMYGVQHQQPQPQHQQPAQPSYDAVQQQYQPRQSAAIEVLTSQFGVPQNYYVGTEAGPASVPAAAMATPSVTAQYSGLSYTSQQSPLSRDTLGSAFAPGMADSSQESTTGAYAHPTYNSHGHPDVDQAYNKYQTVLKQTFSRINEGKLSEAGNSLLEISEWLLSNAESLGLVRDDQSMHADRIKLWEDFNHCWLTALQRQKELTEEMLDPGHRTHAPTSLMDYDFMETLGRELVRLCDMMEKHGLVDYQMGVWEEEIISMLTACLDLIEDQPRASGSSSGAPISPAIRRR